MSQSAVAEAVPRRQLEVKPLPPPSPSPTPSKPRFSRLDLLERVVVLGFYAWFFWRFVNAFVAYPTWQCGLALFSESVTVFFLLTRRPANTISGRAGDWLLALGATIVPLWVSPVVNPLAPANLGVALQLSGVCCQMISKLILGRSFGLIAAHRGLKNFGPYSLVRHPMYAGYLLCHVGFFCSNPTLWNLSVLGLCWCLEIPRLLCEERHLRQDAQYRAYQTKVRFRLIPGVF
jgi:protein-S-isoprenylcysteine O-methyltransferase Ste14